MKNIFERFWQVLGIRLWKRRGRLPFRQPAYKGICGSGWEIHVNGPYTPNEQKGTVCAAYLGINDGKNNYRKFRGKAVL